MINCNLKKISYLLLICFLSTTSYLEAQVYLNFTVNQPAELKANAGEDKNIAQGESVTLGGTASATGGEKDYIFNWSPETYLNSATIEKPVASPESPIKYSLTVTDNNLCQATDTILLTINNLSVDMENKTENSVRVFPNPVQKGSNLGIQHSFTPGLINILVLNQEGREVLSENYNCSDEQKMIYINTSSLQQGIYILKLSNNNFSTVKKIVIE